MKQIEVSQRLNAVIALVEPGNRFADVGCDHGFVPICLVQRGLCPGGLAMDVRSGPLQRAREHIRECGLTEQIEVRQGDGFAAMRPGEADSGILAGMGGPLMVRILEDGREQVQGLKELILSPQSELAEVRSYIRQRNFRILKEVMLREDGKYYTVIKVSTAGPAQSAEAGFEEAEDRYGGYLLRERDAVLADYLNKEEKKLQEITKALQNSDGQEQRRRQRLAELAHSLQQIREIKEHYYEMQ